LLVVVVVVLLPLLVGWNLFQEKERSTKPQNKEREKENKKGGGNIKKVGFPKGSLSPRGFNRALMLSKSKNPSQFVPKQSRRQITKTTRCIGHYAFITTALA